MMATLDPAGADTRVDETAGLYIRPMQLEDIELVHQIDQLSFSVPWPVSSFRYELVENPSSILKVAESGKHLVGAVVVWIILDEAHIATLAVHPEFRQRGISRKLLAAALREAIASGAALSTLEVRAGNSAAQALYRRFGFEVVGKRPRYYKDNNEDALLMTVDFGRSAGAPIEYLKWLESMG